MMKQEEIQDIKKQAIKYFVEWFKIYTRLSDFDQFMLDGRATIEDLDNELDKALEELEK